MRRVLICLLLSLFLRALPSSATAYYLGGTGAADTNSGLSTSAPWATVNHSVLNCGDTITAAAGTYSNITTTVTPGCSAGVHNAVFVGCATFWGCTITGSQTQGGILVNNSYWAFLGWHVSTNAGPNSSAYATCFHATPTDYHHPIHDIYFINDVADGCTANGFSADNGVDYYAAIADIAWNASQGSAYCFSGFNVYQPIATDTAPGTHIYEAQDFAWHNIDPSPCQGFQQATDGEGFTFDTFNAQQSYNGGSTPQYPPYAQQAVMENLISVFNGAAGAGSFGSGNSSAPMYFRNITATRNFRDTNQTTNFCGQIQSIGYPTSFAYNKNAFTTITRNLTSADAATQPGCGSNPASAYMEGNVDTTSLLYGNAGYVPGGNNVAYDGLLSGFSAGPSNLFGVDPAFANPIEPPEPNCAGKASVIDCMSAVIANFKSTSAQILAGKYGYQPVDTNGGSDPVFPKWLCNPNIPSGLISMRCDPAPLPVNTTSFGTSVASTTSSAAKPFAAATTGPNGNFNGVQPFPGSSIYTDISGYPVSSHNPDFQCYYGTSTTSGCASHNYGIKFDWSGTQYETFPDGIPYNWVDLTAHPATQLSRGVFEGLYTSDPTSTPAPTVVTSSYDVPMPIYSGLLQEGNVDPTTNWPWQYAPGQPAPPGDTDQHLEIATQQGWLYECYQCKRINGLEYSYDTALWDMTKSMDGQHPFGKTSADAVGRPIFPYLVRPEEVLGTATSYTNANGAGITHRMRVTLKGVSNLFGDKGCMDGKVTHQAGGNGSGTPTACYGMLLRLHSTYPLTGKSAVCTRVLTGLMHYGMEVNDNGDTGFISGVGDARYQDDDLLSCAAAVHMSDFDWVDMSNGSNPPLFTADSNDTQYYSDGTRCDSTGTCTVQSGGHPTSLVLAASSSTVALGSSVTLTGSATNATLLWTDCGGYFSADASGTQVITPNYTPVICTLFADGLGGWTQSSTPLSITVTGPTAAAPTLTPSGGSYSSAQSVSMATTTSGASIGYTTDGSTPGSYSTVYGGPVSVPVTATVKAAAFENGYLTSPVTSATYTIAGSPAQLVSNQAASLSGSGTTYTFTVNNPSSGLLNLIGTVQGSTTTAPFTAAPTITGSGGGTCAAIISQSDAPGGGNGVYTRSFADCPNAPSGPVTYTLTYSSAPPNAPAVNVFTWSGAALTNPIEGAVSNTNASNPLNLGTVVTTAANDIIFASGGVPYGNVAWGSGFTMLSVSNAQAGYQVESSAGSYPITQTENTTDHQIGSAFAIRHN